MALIYIKFITRDQRFLGVALQFPCKFSILVVEAQRDRGTAALPGFGHEHLILLQLVVRDEWVHGHAFVGESNGRVEYLTVCEVDLPVVLHARDHCAGLKIKFIPVCDCDEF